MEHNATAELISQLINMLLVPAVSAIGLALAAKINGALKTEAQRKAVEDALRVGVTEAMPLAEVLKAEVHESAAGTLSPAQKTRIRAKAIDTANTFLKEKGIKAAINLADRETRALLERTVNQVR